MGLFNFWEQKKMKKELRKIFGKHFSFITNEYGYNIESSVYDKNSFGNFIIELSNGPKRIKIISDRSQIFIEILNSEKGWIDKEVILKVKGIPHSRFINTELGLWTGYEIENQAIDLKNNWIYLDL